MNYLTGGATALAGGVLCSTGIGCLAGGPMILLGTDDVYEGLNGGSYLEVLSSTYIQDGGEAGSKLDSVLDMVGMKGLVTGSAKLAMDMKDGVVDLIYRSSRYL